MADRSVKLLLTADVKGLVNNLKTGAKALEELSAGAKKFGPAASAQTKQAEAAFLKTGRAAHEAAGRQGLLYDSNGKLQDAFGRTVSKAQAAKLGLKEVSDEARYASEHADKLSDSLQMVGKGAMIGGAAMLAGVGIAVKSFADFDKAMSSVRAASHETEGNMDLLRKAAIDAGADTAFSAAEAAQGIEELSKAGVSTADILGGGLDGALALAAAGALDVGAAAELSATALTQFKLSGEQIPHVADLLSAGAGKAQGSVEDMGAALKQSGLVASQVGLSIEETTGGLAAFASAGLIGSDAGTSFKSMLQRLTPQSDKAAKLMGELGLNAYDAQGNFVGLSEYAGILQGALAGMTAEQRNATMSTLFGSDAVRAAAVLYEQGAEGVQKWEDAVNDAGHAAETAALLQDNLAGDLEKLGGSLDSVFLKSGSGANDVLRGLVQGLEGLVDMVGDIPAPILNMGLMFAGVAGGASLMGGAVITALPKIRDSIDAFNTLAPAGGRVRGSLMGAAKAAGVAAAAFAALTIARDLHNQMQPAAMSVDEVQQKLIKLGEQKGVISDVFANIDMGEGDKLDGKINNVADAVERLTSGGISDSMARFGADILGYDNAMAKLRAGFEQTDTVMAGMVQSGSIEAASAGFREVAAAAEASGKDSSYAAELLPGYMDALRETASTLQVSVTDQELFNWALTGVAPAAVAAADGARTASGEMSTLGAEAETTAASLDDILASLFALGVVTMDSRDATAAFEGSLRDAKQTVTDLATEEAKLNETGETLGSVLQKNGKDFDLASEAGSRANAAFQDVARSGMAEFEAKAREGAGTKELQGSLKDTYNGMVTTAKGFGMGAKEANALAREVLGVPDGVSVKSWMSDAAKRAAEETSRALDLLDGRTINTYANHHNTTYVKTVNEGWADTNRAPQTGGKRGRFATGGRLPRTGLGTDKILGVNSAGVPTAWVDDEEWVINKRSSDKHDRLLGMINRDDPALAALGGLAAGGRAGWSKRDQKNEWRDLKRATAARRQEEKDQKAAQRAYDRIDGTKDNRDAKRAAKRRLDAAKAATKRAKKAEDAAKSEYKDAQARTGRLSEDTRDLKTDLRRGNIRDSVMSGNGLSVVDRLFDESRNQDLSKKQRANLGKVAKSSETQLLKMEKQSDKLAKSLEKATSRYEDLVNIRDSVASGLKGEQSLSGFLGLMDEKAQAQAEKSAAKVEASLAKVSKQADDARTKYEGLLSARDGIQSQLTGSFDLGGLLGQTNAWGYDAPVNKKTVLDYGKQKAAGAKKLSDLVAKLQGKGFSPLLLEQVIDEWASAGTFQLGDALLSMNKSEASSLNKSLASVESYGKKAGTSFASSMHKGGINAAQDLMKGLESQESKLQGTISKIMSPDASGKITGKGMIDNAKHTANRIRGFADKLSKLAQRGLSGVILQEIAMMGTEEGTRAADALLAGSSAASKSKITDLNAQYKRIAEHSKRAGVFVTEGFFDGGVNAALGIKKGLESQQKVLDDSMTKLAKSMEKALKKAWGIQSPSTVMADHMGWLGKGGVKGLKAQEPAMAKAMADLIPAPNAEFGSWSVGGGSTYRAMSAPVMELSAADRALMSEFIAASQNMPDMKLVIDRRQAGTIVLEGNKAVRTLK